MSWVVPVPPGFWEDGTVTGTTVPSNVGHPLTPPPARVEEAQVGALDQYRRDTLLLPFLPYPCRRPE